MSKAQTATEYLIILAVVIIIALIVVGVLGGIPSIGGGVNQRTQSLILESQNIGISNFFVGTNHTQLTLKNNQNIPVTIDSVTIGNVTCSASVNLNPGERSVYKCFELSGDVEEDYFYSISMNWTDDLTALSYTQQSQDILLQGEVVDNGHMAMYFDGIDDRVTLVPVTIDFSKDFFVEFDLQHYSNDNVTHLFSDGNTYSFAVYPGSFSVLIGSPSGDVGRLNFAGYNPDPGFGYYGNLHRIRFEWDVSEKTGYLYVNGNLVGSDDIPSPGTSTISSWKFGERSGNYFEGVLTNLNFNGVTLPAHGSQSSDWFGGTINGDPTEIYIS